MGDDSAYFAENSMQDALIHSVGSLPTQNIDDWTSNEFVPVPIKVKVRGMEEIIRPKWEIWHPNSGGNLGQIPFDPEDPVGGGNLNSTRIQSFFIPMFRPKAFYHPQKGNNFSQIFLCFVHLMLILFFSHNLLLLSSFLLKSGK